jgi:hypothetical protein
MVRASRVDPEKPDAEQTEAMTVKGPLTIHDVDPVFL